MQPGSNGNFFATACRDGILRLFDTRLNKNGELIFTINKLVKKMLKILRIFLLVDAMLQVPKRPGYLNTAMFSPSEPLVIAVAGCNDGTFLYDIRNLNRFQYQFLFLFLVVSITYFIFLLFKNSRLFSFPSFTEPRGARFNQSGTQLLCSGLDPQLTVYDLPSLGNQSSFAATGKVTLGDLDFSNEAVSYDACCFAGINDELVVSGSGDHNLHIWSLPDGKGQDLLLNRSLHILHGHEDIIRCVRSSPDKRTIVSCGDDGTIKLWTPTFTSR